MEWNRGPYRITCDPSEVDLDVVSTFLAGSYWARGIPAETVRKSLQHSLCFSLLYGGSQVGFARVISDYATIAYLGDVFVLPEHRHKGLAAWLIDCVVNHPELQGLRRWLLATLDAHGLYERFGFSALGRPEVFMERHDPDVYRR